jgi:hypothetical protein
MNQEIKESPAKVQNPRWHASSSAEMPMHSKVVMATGDSAPQGTEVDEPKHISRASLIVITCLVMLCNLTQASRRTLHHRTQQN